MSQRCFSHAGGSCTIQEPAAIKKIKDWNNRGKISRTEISMFAVIFCAALIGGMGLIKFMQSRHKKIKTRELLERGALRRPNMPAAVSSQQNIDYEDGGLQSNGDSMRAQQVSVS